MIVEELFVYRSSTFTRPRLRRCANNDNVDLNFLTAWYCPREFVQCLPWNFASSRKLCSLKASGRRTTKGVLTKRVTVKCCSVKLTEFMLVAAVLTVASTSYGAQYSKVSWLFEKCKITTNDIWNFHLNLRRKILYYVI